MHFKKLKVRTGRGGHFNPCASETIAMLSCWAAKGDKLNVGDCAVAAKELHECMANSSRNRGRSTNTINYHLARLQKVLK